MENITTSAELKNAIELLEAEQILMGGQLKEQFRQTYESVRPFNLFMGALKNVAASPFWIDSILGAVMSLTTGYFSKKILLGVSGGLLRKFFGSVMQFGITKLVLKYPNIFKKS